MFLNFYHNCVLKCFILNNQNQLVFNTPCLNTTRLGYFLVDSSILERLSRAVQQPRVLRPFNNTMHNMGTIVQYCWLGREPQSAFPVLFHQLTRSQAASRNNNEYKRNNKILTILNLHPKAKKLMYFYIYENDHLI